MHSSLAKTTAISSPTPPIPLFRWRKPQPDHFSFSFSPRKPSTVALCARFVDEMRSVALKEHSRGETKEGERESEGPPITKWEPTGLAGYLKFLVDSSLVYRSLERGFQNPDFPEYSEFRETGLERWETLEKDLEWFEKEGHVIPEASPLGIGYAEYLDELSRTDPQAFICHFFMIYFGNNAGGRIIMKKVTKFLNGKELEFYKYEGDLPQMLQNARDKINQVGETWNREEKNRCLQETQKSIKLYGDILRLIIS